MIIIDSREQKPWSMTAAWNGVDYTISTMTTGDYTNGNIIIERKSVPDICNCCGKQKKRFWKELERGFDVLIIEGQMSEIASHLKRRHSRMTPQYIKKCLKEIHEDFGIDVLLCESREEAAKTALALLEVAL